MTTLTLVKKTSFTVASLATTMLLSICTPVRAFMFGTGGIQFDRDTNINFTFDQSHGNYQSSLWVAQAESGNTGYSNIARLFYETKPSDNGSADDWQGSFGNAVTSDNGSITQTFKFLQDQTYALLLWSDSGTGKQFEQYASSSRFMNSPKWFAANTQFRRDDCLVAGCQQAVFGNFNLDYNSTNSFTNINGGKGPEQFSSVTMTQLAQGTKISFDDVGGGNDLDFQDFSVSAELAPEPVTVFGTMLGIGALAAARRKKKRGQ
ncbi:PEP motif putative anchor domain protein [Oscillatoria nigro-viridis PCC 7112]|uniref:PEP motif putative anchor domain protein n=1 Tax=Phormidium nigroviride PCC 7112 TaxID=179408 RepID=K9VD69_9CYAN|nr:PEP-CTERM sorting domain-containing protein [Oscillatoria nigro-viridis]AFZ06078.1 PEP motif putative anchor domain protein [Oscillatoria nigro-viridis PCC 7112]